MRWRAICAVGLDTAREAESMAHNADAATQLGCRVMHTHLRLIHGEAADIEEELAELAWLGTLVGPDAPEELVSLGRLIVFDLMTLGRWDQADDLATRIIAQARSAGLRGVESFVHGLRGEVAWRRGRWIEARGRSVVRGALQRSEPRSHRLVRSCDPRTSRSSDGAFGGEQTTRRRGRRSRGAAGDGRAGVVGSSR